MYFVHLYGLHVYCALVDLVFWLCRCPSHTWAHIKYPSSLCVCTRVYKHTRTHHANTRKNRQIYKTKPLSLPLPKHSLPRQQQALTMNKPLIRRGFTSNEKWSTEVERTVRNSRFRRPLRPSAVEVLQMLSTRSIR